MKLSKEMLQSTPFLYANQVRSGEIITGNWMRLVVARFFSWIETAEADGYYLDHNEGMRIINFFPKLLNHTKGTLAGQPFHLLHFQQFCLYNVFGWKNKNGQRRINKVYDKRAKKNGKTAEMAGVALYMMCLDGENESEVYVGATKEDQAKICWKQARQFIDSSVANPGLKHIGFYCKQREIIYKPAYSVLMPLGGDSKTQDGINAHFSIIDEYHAHTDDSVKENLESSSVQRLQPLMYQITTAGTNVASVCKQYEDVCKDILQGIIKDDHTWIMIHELDKEDNWEDTSKWVKANPLLGTALDIERIKVEFTSAKNQISKVPNFKTKHLNMWVDAPQIWIPNEIWKQNEIESIPLDAFKNYGSYSAIDLSSTIDFTADAFISEPDETETRYLKVYLYCPEDTIDKRSKEDRVPYRSWRDQGYITSTPGNVCDYNIIEANHVKYSQQYNVKRTELDKWNATSTAINLQEAGLQVSFFSQAISNMSFPTKQFEKLIYEGKIKYEYNPVLEWMLSGCAKIEDPNGNVKIHKGKSNANGKRVDGIIASIMALGGSLSMKPEPGKYEKPLNEIYV